jgi:hypothetical protein
LLFIICGHNILFNIAEVVKQVHVMQMKPNKVLHYIIQHAQHMKWHVRIFTKLGYRGPGLNLTCLRQVLAFLSDTTKSRHDGLPSVAAPEMLVELASHNSTVRTRRTLATALWNANPDRSLRLQTESASARIYRCSISPRNIQGIVIYMFPREGRDNKWSDMSMSKANIRA